MHCPGQAGRHTFSNGRPNFSRKISCAFAVSRRQPLQNASMSGKYISEADKSQTSHATSNAAHSGLCTQLRRHRIQSGSCSSGLPRDGLMERQPMLLMQAVRRPPISMRPLMLCLRSRASERVHSRAGRASNCWGHAPSFPAHRPFVLYFKFAC